MTTRGGLATALIVLCACSSEPAEPADFAGSWSGMTRVVVSGSPQGESSSWLYVINGTDGGVLRIAGPCASDGLGPPAVETDPPLTVTGPHTFRIEPTACPFQSPMVAICDSFTRVITGGTGSLNGGTLSVTLNADQKCAPSPSFAITTLFTGTKLTPGAQ